MKRKIREERFSTWYDGFVYEKLLSPESAKLRAFLAVFVRRGSVVLDVGCGVGSLVFELSKKCKYVVGVDLSERMIAHAEKIKSRLRIENVEFILADAAKLSQTISQHFDLIMIALCLHELRHQSRQEVVAGCLKLADSIIIADFAAPFPKNRTGTLLRMQEAFAGKRHFHNFKNWIDAGGIDGFLKETGLIAHKIVPWDNRAGKIAVITSPYKNGAVAK